MLILLGRDESLEPAWSGTLAPPTTGTPPDTAPEHCPGPRPPSADERGGVHGQASGGRGVRHRDAGLPREDMAELDKLPVEGRVEGRAERELDRPGRSLGWGLGSAHV